MLVTPLRDGMNLVAKEFVASRTDEDGVLVLSEFAGAADELGEALIVNPYDIDVVADGDRARADDAARRAPVRMRALRRRVTVGDRSSTGSRRFLDALESSRPGEGDRAREEVTLIGTHKRSIGQVPLSLLLDYDGTLVPLAEVPELARQTPPCGPSSSSSRAAGRRGTRRERPTARRTRRWFGDLPVGLWAEHGLWRRDPGRAVERIEARRVPPWMAFVRR